MLPPSTRPCLPGACQCQGASSLKMGANRRSEVEDTGKGTDPGPQHRLPLLPSLRISNDRDVAGRQKKQLQRRPTAGERETCSTRAHKGCKEKHSGSGGRGPCSLSAPGLRTGQHCPGRSSGVSGAHTERGQLQMGGWQAGGPGAGPGRVTRLSSPPRSCHLSS